MKADFRLYKLWRCQNNTEFDNSYQGCVDKQKTTTTARPKLDSVVTTTTEGDLLKPSRHDAGDMGIHQLNQLKWLQL